jgi:hypothetical protein
VVVRVGRFGHDDEDGRPSLACGHKSRPRLGDGRAFSDDTDADLVTRPGVAVRHRDGALLVPRVDHVQVVVLVVDAGYHGHRRVR